MKCPECGVKITGKPNFCPNCGEKMFYEPPRSLKKIMFFDTETSGIFADEYSNNPYENFPILVQLGWVVCNREGEIINTREYIIKPSNYEIPDDSVLIHGITTKDALELGTDIFTVLKFFYHDLITCDLIVAHNYEFDKKIVRYYNEINGFEDLFQETVSFCTMASSTDFCKLPRKDGYSFGYKYPTLDELHQKLFNYFPDDRNVHSALEDSKIVAKCFFDLINIGVIDLTKIDDQIYLESQTGKIFAYENDLKDIINRGDFEEFTHTNNKDFQLKKQTFEARRGLNSEGYIVYLDEVLTRLVYVLNFTNDLITIFDWTDSSYLLVIDAKNKKIKRIGKKFLTRLKTEEIKAIYNCIIEVLTSSTNLLKDLIIKNVSNDVLIDADQDVLINLRIEGCFVHSLEIELGSSLVFKDSWNVEKKYFIGCISREVEHKNRFFSFSNGEGKESVLITYHKGTDKVSEKVHSCYNALGKLTSSKEKKYNILGEDSI